MVGIYCCVPGCKSSTRSKDKVSFHLFPLNIKIKEEWLRRINRRTENGTLWQPGHFHKICGKHFNKSGKKGSYNKYPIYFPNHEIADYDVRQVQIDEDFELGKNEEIGEQEELNVLLDIKNEPECMDSSTQCVDESIHLCHDHTYAKSGNYLIKLEANQVAVNNLETKVQFLTHELESKEKELKILQNEMYILKCKYKKLQKNKIENNLVRSLKNDDSLLRFYTGCVNNTQFKIFVDLIRPAYVLARKSKYKNEKVSGNSILNMEEQLVLVLIKLRLKLLEQDLAFRFRISVGTVSRTWTFWINFLYSQLSQLPDWLGKTIADNHRVLEK